MGPPNAHYTRSDFALHRRSDPSYKATQGAIQSTCAPRKIPPTPRI